MKLDEVVDRINRGDIPSQHFHHAAKNKGYKWVRKYWFADGEYVTAQIISMLLKQRRVQLVIDGSNRRVELYVDPDVVTVTELE